MNTALSASDAFTQCYERDNYTCQDCGSTERLEVHHILPISQGGNNDLDNLKVVCFDCHRKNYKDVHFPKDKNKIIPHEQRVKDRGGIDKNRFKQVILHLNDEMSEQIEKYWHDNQLKNRSETIRELIQKGLESK